SDLEAGIEPSLVLGRKQFGLRSEVSELIADGLLFKPSVFALHTKSEETLVSSWIDLIAFARSGAILSTFILSNSHALARSGIVLVTIICSISEASNCSIALPDNTGCVKQA